MLVILFIIEDIVGEQYFIKRMLVSASNSEPKSIDSSADEEKRIQEAVDMVTDSLPPNQICLTRKRLAIINHYKSKGWKIINVQTEKKDESGAETVVYMETPEK